MDDQWPPTPLRWPDRALADGAVALDRMVDSDIPAIVDAVDDEMLRWLPLPSPYTIDEAIAFLAWQAEMAAQGTTLNFAVRHTPGGQLLGSIGLHFRNGPGVAEIGYWIGPAARGRGLAAAGTRLLAAFAFDVYGPRRVELLIQPGNLGSIRSAERAGATFEGIRRAALDIRGQPQDAAVYAFLPGEAIARLA